MPINVHIINHTHWDREWFLTSVYTSQWIPDLIDKLLELTRDNPDFRFLLDGQTLIIEDLLNLKPDYREKVERLVRSGRLLIGPYYCQPDWRLTSGELLYRNLLYGRRDMKRFGAGDAVGWLVDTFGHISQAPQLHRLFDLNSVYVWRGVPRLEPYFVWKGSFGQDLFAINLFGGYRNLYGVSHAPEVATQRLLSEVRKLSPFYPTPDIPLFDGYDLEQNPEDPVRFYHERGHLPADVHLLDSSPIRFSRAMQQTLTSLPSIEGELNSGKYGATFPGALSTRTYLKIMHHDCEHALFQRCEPLAVLAALNGRDYPSERYEAWTRKLLQNAIHDCICGVSVDPVHEKMERSYQELFQAIYEDIGHSLAYILKDFASGTYAISTNPFPYQGWRVVEGRLFRLRTEGIGAWPVDSPAAVERLHKPIETFEWRNAHYEARVDADGVVHIDDAGLGQLVVMEEVGDAYSDEAGEWCEVCKPDGSLRLVEQGPFHAVLAYETTLRIKGIFVSAAVRLIFDDSPLIRWLVELDSRGVNFRVEMRFETGHDGVIRAGMPFDRVERPWLDDDFLPRELDEPLNSVLLGQREVEAV
ncbi:MAG: hypothetical protein GXP42_14110, partial [Chloroflexi bacterium]|nr:hypothetical protein [Chloroflexota bacterium]